MTSNLMSIDWAGIDWPALLIHILIGVSILFAALLVFLGLDYLTGTTRTRRCTVIDKRYTPACTSTGCRTAYDAGGNLTTVTTFNFHPANYSLIVRVDGHVTSYETNADFWARVRVGQSLDLEFRYGGMTGCRY